MPIIAWLTSKLTSQIALPLLAGLLLLNFGTGIGLVLTRHTLELRSKELAAEQKAHAADLATFAAATAQAEANDKQHALAVQQAQDQISQEKQNDLQTQLASARSIAAQFVRSHAAQTDRRGSSDTPVPVATDAASQPDSTPANAVVSAADIDACAIDYTIAKGWQDWWKQEQSVVNVTTTVHIINPAIRAESDSASDRQTLAVSIIDPIPVTVAVANIISEHPTTYDSNTVEQHGEQSDQHKNFLP